MHYRAKKNFHYSVPQHIWGYNTQKCHLKGKNAKNQYMFVYKKNSSHQSFEGTWRLRNEEKI